MSVENRVIFGQLGRLKPEKIEEYEALHAAPWTEVLQTIHDCNLRNYSIFREGEQVFAYFEYIGEDYEADMEKWRRTLQHSSGGRTQSPASKRMPSAQTANSMRI